MCSFFSFSFAHFSCQTNGKEGVDELTFSFPVTSTCSTRWQQRHQLLSRHRGKREKRLEKPTSSRKSCTLRGFFCCFSFRSHSVLPSVLHFSWQSFPTPPLHHDSEAVVCGQRQDSRSNSPVVLVSCVLSSLNSLLVLSFSSGGFVRHPARQRLHVKSETSFHFLMKRKETRGE